MGTKKQVPVVEVSQECLFHFSLKLCWWDCVGGKGEGIILNDSKEEQSE